MFRSRLFLKLFVGFTSLSLLSAAALLAITWQGESQDHYRRTEAELRTVASVLVGRSDRFDPTMLTESDLQDLAVAAGAEVTVYSPAGRPIVSSAEAPQENDPSVKIALQAGQSWRPATDTSDRFTYDRVWRNAAGQPAAVVRVARSAASLAEWRNRLWRLYAWYALATSVLVLAAGFTLVSHLVRPVQTLNRVAQSMAAGDYDQRAFVPNRDELGALADSYNRLSRELGRRLTELRESDQLQATVLGGMIEGVVAIDDRKRVLFANPAAGKLFGFLPPQVEGRPLLEVVRNHPLHQAATAAIVSRRPQRLEIDWEEHQLAVHVTPLVGDPSTGAVVVLHDTTELNRLESLRRDFVANVSHELKTPLSSIKAYTETLLGGAAEEAATRTRFLREIEEQANRLDELIRDMLDLARIESAQQPFAIQTVGVTAAVEACRKHHAPRAEAKQVRLLVDDQSPLAQVQADPDGLRVILNNLVDNAVKYTPTGGEVRIDWRVVEQMVEISVADTGIGIPADKAARVFERFYRVDAARSRDLGGTGLGLSIVKHLAQSFGGSVAVQSVPQQGTKFIVSLPAA
ncbi:HAMP domain-containing sensor histidine kinase [Botrimarina hoheduenensis]|uniref:histidine kinase n=1 Tax=Botrimarina hoheduenensis TaxID=2528000 RepID=A0A5C5VY14_9BACT|nr:HAMP domain-containing sensor histidine kinase [Botrimarina hoheduenensis]TWT43350.1 Alkaline phosphatase synthesis sensor protein PhoR [Botrimarina hoheduenensis]